MTDGRKDESVRLKKETHRQTDMQIYRHTDRGREKKNVSKDRETDGQRDRMCEISIEVNLLMRKLKLSFFWTDDDAEDGSVESVFTRFLVCKIRGASRKEECHIVNNRPKRLYLL